ncbi:MAG: glycerophosphodiester phosphodiesterase family protein [Firmicutes bacterium]|nr:glycerophosphodiester phosphodiesterase family protein [Bacillota bacterium]
MLAFNEAAKYPIAGFELDVHLTKDGVPVICHDEDIKRTSNGSGLIKDMTLAELRTYLLLIVWSGKGSPKRIFSFLKWKISWPGFKRDH